MDPNEALRLIRAYIKQMRVEDTPAGGVGTSPTFVQHARDLAETVEGLDEWLSKDGFLPADWRSDDEKNQILCRCGTPIIDADGEWQHDRAPYVWGDDHEAVPS
jgi:hypothetical protein